MANIKPIRTEQDHSVALARIEALWGAEPGTGKGDELDILVSLVAHYEDEHHAIEAPDPIALIRHVMEARGLKNADLVDYIGKSGRVSEVLNRKRPLTLPMIRRLTRGLGVPAEALIEEYEVRRG